MKPAHQQETIRVSCAALCRIEIDGKFLLEINKNRGDVITPIGGALEFYENARPFLESLGAEFQNGNDLRLIIPKTSLPAFREWFVRNEDRETDPLRELREELIDEHGVLPSWPEGELKMSYLRLVEIEEATTRVDQQGRLTHYFYEIFSVGPPEEVEAACVDTSSLPGGSLRLFSHDNLAVINSNSSLRIAETTRIVIET